MSAPTGFFRGENGLVLEMDLPLSDAFAGRLKRGEIVRVADAEGHPWVDDETEPAAVAERAPAGDGPTAAEHAAAVADLADAQAELELATKQRDQLAAELATVTAERDALAAAANHPPEVPTPPKAAKSTK